VCSAAYSGMDINKMARATIPIEKGQVFTEVQNSQTAVPRCLSFTSAQSCVCLLPGHGMELPDISLPSTTIKSPRHINSVEHRHSQYLPSDYHLPESRMSEVRVQVSGMRVRASPKPRARIRTRIRTEQALTEPTLLKFQRDSLCSSKFYLSFPTSSKTVTN